MHIANKLMNDEYNKFELSTKRFLEDISNFRSMLKDIPLEFGSFGHEIMNAIISDTEALENEITRRRVMYRNIISSINRNIDFSNFTQCDYCKEIIENEYIYDAPRPYNDKKICDECIKQYFFICKKCNLELPRDEIGKVIYDYKYCKKCSSPKGLPDNIFILKSEKVALIEKNNLDDCIDYDWSESQIQDFQKQLIPANLQKKLSNTFAIYKDINNEMYKIEEFDCRGVSEEIEILTHV